MVDREAIAVRLRAAPEKSTQKIANEFGVCYNTVYKVRQELEAKGEIPKMDRGCRNRNRQKAAKVLDLFCGGNEPKVEEPDADSAEKTFDPVEGAEESYEDVEEPAPLTDDERWSLLKAAVEKMAEIFAGATPSLWANKVAREEYLVMWSTWDKVVWAMCRFDDPKAVPRKFDGFADELDGEDDEAEDTDEDDLLW